MTLLCRHFVTSDIRRLRKTLTYLLILLRNTATIDKLVFSIFMGGRFHRSYPVALQNKLSAGFHNTTYH